MLSDDKTNSTPCTAFSPFHHSTHASVCVIQLHNAKAGARAKRRRRRRGRGVRRHTHTHGTCSPPLDQCIIMLVTRLLNLEYDIEIQPVPHTHTHVNLVIPISRCRQKPISVSDRSWSVSIQSVCGRAGMLTNTPRAFKFSLHVSQPAASALTRLLASLLLKCGSPSRAS